MVSRNMGGGLGLNGDWDLGEDGWKEGMDANLLKLSVLVQGGAVALVSATPGSPAEGSVYLFSDTHPTNPNSVAVYDESAWTFYAAEQGWLIYDNGSSVYRSFDGATWAELATGGGSGGSTAYRVGFFATTALSASEVAAIHVFTDAAEFSANFAGSRASVGVNPGASFVMSVQKNGAEVGTITISTAGVITFATSGGAAVSFAAGDVLRVVGPATAGTAANFAVTLRAETV